MSVVVSSMWMSSECVLLDLCDGHFLLFDLCVFLVIYVAWFMLWSLYIV